MSFSPRVIGQADAALSRVIAETSKTPSASQYWERKRPLYRQLAIRDFRQTDLKNRVNFTESLGQMMQISLSLI